MYSTNNIRLYLSWIEGNRSIIIRAQYPPNQFPPKLSPIRINSNPISSHPNQFFTSHLHSITFARRVIFPKCQFSIGVLFLQTINFYDSISHKAFCLHTIIFLVSNFSQSSFLHGLLFSKFDKIKLTKFI